MHPDSVFGVSVLPHAPIHPQALCLWSSPSWRHYDVYSKPVPRWVSQTVGLVYTGGSMS
jgi:hypothetical protein